MRGRGDWIDLRTVRTDVGLTYVTGTVSAGLKVGEGGRVSELLIHRDRSPPPLLSMMRETRSLKGVAGADGASDGEMNPILG